MVFLSFDVEEFDVPLGKNTAYSPLKEGVDISNYGLKVILGILNEFDIKATFFCTADFVKSSPDTIQNIIKDGHEIASHGVSHFRTKGTDPTISKQRIESIVKTSVLGYRQPRMGIIDTNILIINGYNYNASINPTLIPGRYNHLNSRRLPYKEGRIIHIPASVTPVFRIPVFWLSLHLFPVWFYLLLCKTILLIDKNLNTYFHPWEFYPLGSLKDLKLSPFITHNTGHRMEKRFRRLISYLAKHGNQFGTYSDYCRIINCLNND